jgi:hypothetical protein
MSALPEVSAPGRCLQPRIFNRFHVASVLHFHLHRWLNNGMQNVAAITDDLENREISAPGIHGVDAKWVYGGGAGPGAEGAF